MGVEVLRKKVLLFFLFAPSKNKSLIWDFVKKHALHSFVVALKKANNNNNNNERDDEHNEHAIETVVVKTERR